jgi:dolichol kinase
MTVEAATRLSLEREFHRKALHLLWSFIPLAYSRGVVREVLLVVLGMALAVALIIEVARVRIPLIGRAFTRATGTLLRPHEHIHWSGATWLLLSFLALVALFPRSVAIAAMWAVAVGDAAAALVGRAWGAKHPGRAGKTLAGSTACAIATAMGTFFIAGLPVPHSIVSGVIAAVAEWPRRPLDDNLRIGLAVGVGILLCCMAFS